MSTLKKTENNLEQDGKVRSLWKQSIIQFKHSRLAVVGLVVIVSLIAMILVTLAANQITNYSFYNEYILKQDSSLRLARSSLAHLFGRDEFGKDLPLRILWGTKLSLAIGVVTTALSMIMEAPFDMIAAFHGSKTDNAIMRVMDMPLIVPYMLLATAIVAVLRTSTFSLLLTLAVSGIAKYARITRVTVPMVKDSEFVRAVQVVDASDGITLPQYILSNALTPIPVQVPLGIGDPILVIAGLSYLELGVQPPQPEWGATLTIARTCMRDARHISVFPGLFLILAVTVSNLSGDDLRDALDPKLKR